MVFLLTAEAGAQSFRVKGYSEALPVTEVLAVAQVPDGVLWLIIALALCSLGFGVASLLQQRRRNEQLESLVEERTRALRDAEERYREIFIKNLAPQLLVDGESGTILAVNQAAEEHHGRSEAELVDTAFVDLMDDVDGELQRSLDELRQGEPLRRSAQQLIEGELRHVEIHACTYELQGRRLVHATVFDVTEHRLLEEQLLLAQRLESVGRLAGGGAHDFNNLLTAVMGHVEIARLDIGDKKLMAKHLDVVAEAAMRGAKLTTQLLGFARQQPSAPRPLDLDAQLTRLEPVLRGLLREDIELRLELGSEHAGVHIDPSQLEQVLLNLVVNAIDSMRLGGVISISTRTVLEDQPQVCLSVRDTGVGMDADTCARIFEPFFTTKPVGEGTGLGLSMCDGIVKQHGGRLLVDSAPGEGSTFEIYLPALDRPVDPGEQVFCEPPAAAAGTILLVEDDPVVGNVVAESLRRLDYTVLQAANGVTALKLAQEHEGPIDLLLSDVIMPQMGGPELARQLKQRLPGLKVLFMSGHATDALDSQGISPNSIDLIEKPFQVDELACRVRAVVERGPGRATVESATVLAQHARTEAQGGNGS